MMRNISRLLRLVCLILSLNLVTVFMAADIWRIKWYNLTITIIVNISFALARRQQPRQVSLRARDTTSAGARAVIGCWLPWSTGQLSSSPSEWYESQDSAWIRSLLILISRPRLLIVLMEYSEAESLTFLNSTHHGCSTGYLYWYLICT